MEGVGPETQVHKITNVPVFYMALGLNDFDAVKSVTHKSLHPTLYKQLGEGRPLERVGPETQVHKITY